MPALPRWPMKTSPFGAAARKPGFARREVRSDVPLGAAFQTPAKVSS
jgi:hypothetical protein